LGADLTLFMCRSKPYSLPMDWFPLAFALIVIFLAAVVRGYSGFGFSLLTITALSLVYAPAEVIPAIFILEIAASLHLLPAIWKHVHWRSLVPLLLGCLVATPFGVWALASLPAPPMQLALSLFVLIAVALMAKGFALTTMPGPSSAAAAGAAAGLANGAFGIGGPPVILFYFASPAGHATGRASLIVFFLATDVIGLANQGPHGLVTWDSALRALLFLPVLVAGVWIGARTFKSANPETFRKAVLLIMAILAMLLGVKATSQLL
jgi:uncharacterized protein